MSKFISFLESIESQNPILVAKVKEAYMLAESYESRVGAPEGPTRTLSRMVRNSGYKYPGSNQEMEDIQGRREFAEPIRDRHLGGESTAKGPKYYILLAGKIADLQADIEHVSQMVSRTRGTKLGEQADDMLGRLMDKLNAAEAILDEGLASVLNPIRDRIVSKRDEDDEIAPGLPAPKYPESDY